MLKMIIDGVIGYDVLAADIRDQLQVANGNDLEIEINSPGGSVYEGFTIYNLIKKYKQEHPEATIKAVITGLAASMGSIIPLAADSIEVFDTSVLMIHLPWTIALGNSEDFRVIVERLEKLGAMSAKVYSKKTGMDQAEILELMKAESFFYGSEIVENGFADSLLSSDEDSDKDELLIMAKMSIESAQAKFSEKDKIADLEKAVALFKPAEKAEKIKEGAKKMDLMELLQSSPEAKAEYEAALMTAKAEGEKAERERVSELMEFATVSKSISEAIAQGMDAGDFAKAELKAHKKAQDKAQELGTFEPKENREPVEPVVAKEKESKKIDDVLDAYFARGNK